jgi:hypothetical protein
MTFLRIAIFVVFLIAVFFFRQWLPWSTRVDADCWATGDLSDDNCSACEVTNIGADRHSAN